MELPSGLRAYCKVPKLYEYLGIYIHFHAGDHPPIHVHGYHQGTENKAEIFVENGQVMNIRFVRSTDAPPLPKAKQRDFEVLVRHEAKEIVEAWNELKRTGIAPRPQSITRKLK